MSEKLNAGQKNLLRLIADGADAEGWAPVRAKLMPLYKSQLSPELVAIECVGDEGHGRVKLTQFGESLINAMKWL